MILITISFQCKIIDGELQLTEGMRIERSSIVASDTFYLPGTDAPGRSSIEIHGDHMVVDFNDALIVGSNDSGRPDLFEGMAIQITGSHITIKNLRVQGYKVAIKADGVDSLKIINCDLSYNYRQKLKSTREQEDTDDWLYLHDNENDEWLDYGAAIYLKNCQRFVISDVRVNQGQNGLMLTGCQEGMIYNNDIRFNSGIGIGLYRSSFNKIMHNKLDFNVRGYSHGIYQRGQDSAGILAYEQSSKNIFAFNSATHSGDGFFLWAGRSTMDSGKGGSSGNLIYKNNFSFAPTNGIEVTFSSNYIIENTMDECRYGIWAGYSFNTLIKGNIISNSDFGIAIEHGHDNAIVNNKISESNVAVKLWQRGDQPEDWGFSKANDVSSRNYYLQGNSFDNNEKLYEITGTTNIRFLPINDAIVPSEVNPALAPPELPTPLSDGISTELEGEINGRKYIIVNEWGPYNHEYPLIWLREVIDDKYVFAMFGPEGNWQITGANGFHSGSIKTGVFPNTLTSMRDSTESDAYINLEFIGASFTDQFGQKNDRGIPYTFSFRN